MRVLPKSCQIAAARALLGMDQRELAELARISVSTLARFEAKGWGEILGNARMINRVLAILEAKGVIFSELGVALSKMPPRTPRSAPG
jgi:transcriptional regulator with XRE-family HTH domain